LKGKLEVADDLVNDRMIFDEGDDVHLAPTGRTEKRIDFIDFPYHLGPAFGGWSFDVFLD